MLTGGNLRSLIAMLTGPISPFSSRAATAIPSREDGRDAHCPVFHSFLRTLFSTVQIGPFGNLKIYIHLIIFFTPQIIIITFTYSRLIQPYFSYLFKIRDVTVTGSCTR
ncbi:hypothetical protein ACOSQ4_031239 [Xanthoceras sorbifolium]